MDEKKGLQIAVGYALDHLGKDSVTAVTLGELTNLHPTRLVQLMQEEHEFMEGIAKLLELAEASRQRLDDIERSQAALQQAVLAATEPREQEED